MHIPVNRYIQQTMVIFFLLFASASTSLGGSMTSASFSIKDDVLSGGGGTSQSTIFILQATLGQPSAIGSSSSTSYTIQPGFWYLFVMLGDINGDGNIDLKDVIRALQVLTGQNIEQVVKEADINGDGRIGFEELLNALNKTAQP